MVCDRYGDLRHGRGTLCVTDCTWLGGTGANPPDSILTLTPGPCGLVILHAASEYVSLSCSMWPHPAPCGLAVHHVPFPCPLRLQCGPGCNPARDNLYLLNYMPLQCGESCMLPIYGTFIIRTGRPPEHRSPRRPDHPSLRITTSAVVPEVPTTSTSTTQSVAPSDIILLKSRLRWLLAAGTVCACVWIIEFRNSLRDETINTLTI